MSDAAAMPAQPSALSLRHYEGSYGSHAHGHVQILLGHSGRLDLEVGGRSLYVDTSCGVVIPAGVDHGFCSPRGSRVLVVDTPAQPRLERVKRFALTAAVASLAQASDAADRIVALAGGVATMPARRGLDLARLDAAVGEALDQPWTTARLAALFTLSPQRFHARLLELRGVTPQQYLRRLRLERAEQALRAGRTLEATALHVGYRSASALAYALRRDRQTGARRLRA